MTSIPPRNRWPKLCRLWVIAGNLGSVPDGTYVLQRILHSSSAEAVRTRCNRGEVGSAGLPRCAGGTGQAGAGDRDAR